MTSIWGIKLPWGGYDTTKKTTPQAGPQWTPATATQRPDLYPAGPSPSWTVPQPPQPTGGGNDVNQAALDEAAKTKKMWESLYMNGLASYEDMQQAINQSRINISRQLNSVKSQYENQKKVLGQQLDTTLQSQGGYFSAISPEAYQSQQGTYANKAQNTYQEAKNEAKSAYSRNRAEQAQAVAQANANQRRANEYKNALETYRNEGGISEPQRPSFAAIKPQYENVDLSGYADKFANLALSNTMAGMSPEQNRISIKKQMTQEGLAPDLQDFLYQDLFPEDYTNAYYPSAADYQALNM